MLFYKEGLAGSGVRYTSCDRLAGKASVRRDERSKIAPLKAAVMLLRESDRKPDPVDRSRNEVKRMAD